MKTSLHFLAYLNRSGSTLLAKKLNSYSNISVGLETQISSSIMESFCITTEKEYEYWIDKVYEDNKFRLWGVSKEKLIMKLKEHDKPLYFRDFLREAVFLLHKEKDSNIAIYKTRKFLSNLNKSDKLFPSSKYIFINRDPRGIFNSQLKSIDSVTREVMQDKVLDFALSYKKYQERLKFYLNHPEYKVKVILIQFEDLLNNEDKELKKIFSFLEIQRPKKLEDESSYFDKIPENQKHLHSNVGKENLINRIDSWKTELNEFYIRLLGFILRKEINNQGYSFYEKSNTKSHSYIFIKNVILFWFKFYPKHFLKKILLKIRVRDVY